MRISPQPCANMDMIIMSNASMSYTNKNEFAPARLLCDNYNERLLVCGYFKLHLLARHGQVCSA